MPHFASTNPHLPGRASHPYGNGSGDWLALYAFNLIPGAAFMLLDEPDPRVWVVERVVRDVNFERVSVWAHDATFSDDFEHESAFVLDFNLKVALVGLSINPSDQDDNNLGV